MAKKRNEMNIWGSEFPPMSNKQRGTVEVPVNTIFFLGFIAFLAFVISFFAVVLVLSR